MAKNLDYAVPCSKYWNKDLANDDKYGRLYNWETAMKDCPMGWLLPSNEKWKPVVNFAGGEEISQSRKQRK